MSILCSKKPHQPTDYQIITNKRHLTTTERFYLHFFLFIPFKGREKWSWEINTIALI